MTWQKYLDNYFKKYKYEFLVQKFAEFPRPWIRYNTKEYKAFIKGEKYVNHREVFPDEIVMDLDCNKELTKTQARLEAQQVAKELSTRLTALGYSHSVWNSGGNGIHIHLFFPELLSVKPVDRKIIKKLFLKDVGQGFIRPREHNIHVQLQDNTLIQLEKAYHRKGGRKTLLYEKLLGLNSLDKKYYEQLDAERVSNHLMSRYFKDRFKGEKPQVIEFLEHDDFARIKDGRDRALFVLTAYYKQTIDGEELFRKLKAWNTRMGNYFNDKTIWAKIKSARAGLPVSIIVDLCDELGFDQSLVSEFIKNK